VTVRQAAARLGMSPSWLRSVAAAAGIDIRRRGRHPGVHAADLEAFLRHCRITRRG
jgi:hypothetical protein